MRDFCFIFVFYVNLPGAEVGAKVDDIAKAPFYAGFRVWLLLRIQSHRCFERLETSGFQAFFFCYCHGSPRVTLSFGMKKP